MATRSGRLGDSAHLIPGTLAGLFILAAGLTTTTQYVAWSYRFGPAIGGVITSTAVAILLHHVRERRRTRVPATDAERLRN